jgi:hypothetical protein
MWMGAFAIVWVLFIAVIGYFAVLAALREADRPPARHGRPTKA